MSFIKRIDIANLDAARAKVVKIFLDQCEFGQQTLSLSNNALASCGQFIGEGARSLAQRGLHGTSAAIAVLADVYQTDSKAHALLPRLVRYASERLTVEETARPMIGKILVEDDNDNIIKISELLLALASVPVISVPNTETLRRQLTKWLKESKLQDKGWAYFRSDPSVGSQLLPTAYAVMALDSVDEDVTGPIQYMLDNLKESTLGSTYDVDATIRSLALYVLAFRKHANQRLQLEYRVLRNLFDSLWQLLEPLLRTESIEQNVQYWRGSTTYSVRVPWQLYILALAARIRMRRFAAKGAQVRVCEVITNLINGEFRYPYSGKMISTRANAIAYATLGYIRIEIERSTAFEAFVWLDHIRSWAGWRAGAYLFATAFIVYSVWSWFTGCGTKQYIDLAPNFVSSVVIYILLWSRKR